MLQQNQQVWTVSQESIYLMQDTKATHVKLRQIRVPLVHAPKTMVSGTRLDLHVS